MGRPVIHSVAYGLYHVITENYYIYEEVITVVCSIFRKIDILLWVSDLT